MKLSVKFAPRSITACLQLALVLPGISSALAEDAKPADAKAVEPPPKKKWESIASADLTLTRGNSRSFLATVTVNTQRKWEAEELLLGAGAGYGNSSTKDSNGQQVTTENQDYLKGFGQFNHLFSDRFYGGVRLEGLHDNVADINYRITFSPMAGYYIIKHTNTFLTSEVGPSLVHEELGHHTQTYLGLRVAERFEHKFDGGAKIWENLEWIPQVDKFDNWILNAEAGISAPVTKALDVRVIAQDTYNNQPAPGRLKNDLKLLAGIGYRF
jgi:putative salt-induced outer membrane protein YdiY